MKRKPTQQIEVDVFAIVRKVGLALPDVEAATRYDGSPTLKVGGSFMAGPATPPSAETGTPAVKYGFEARERPLGDAPGAYYLPRFYRRYPLVLVRLALIESDALRDLLSVSRRLLLTKSRKHSKSGRLDWGC